MTEYYVRVIHDGTSIIEEFWAVQEDVAHQGILPSSLGTHHADSGKDIMTTLRKRGFPPEQFHKLLLGPGAYFPRMARPTSTGQLHALIQELQQICRVVHPIEHNFHAYGHEIRNIIAIACTEVEAQWKNILVANDQKAGNRGDYVKLSLPMKLQEYSVELPWYPWLKPIAPFKNWVLPTKRGEKQLLPWYDAYNAVKHDREKKFAEA